MLVLVSPSAKGKRSVRSLEENSSFVSPLTSSLMDYLCTTAPEVPELTIAHRETLSPYTRFGAKGLGEGNTMSTPAAIANAVADALDTDQVELPLTPPRVWELLGR